MIHSMAREYVIRVIQDADSQPIEHRVTGLPISIGRDSGNDVQVASQFVSGFHAKIEEIKGRVFVRDLGSRNGTQVNTADGAKTRVAAHALYDLAQCGNEFFLGSTVRVQVVDPTHAGGSPWEGVAPRRPADNFMDLPGHGGHAPGLGDLPPLPGLGGGPPQAWPEPELPRHEPYGAGPLSLPPLPGEAGYGSGGPVQERPRRPTEPRDLGRGFEPVGGGHLPPGVGGAGGPNLHTGNFQLNMETLALQGLRELVGSLLPGQQLTTQGDVARLITRLHDAVDVLCRGLIPLRQSYLKFVSSMQLARSAHFAQASALLDMARDPAAVSAALLDFRESAPEASKALESALNDLATHQVAMLDGVMQGVRALLEELSPEAVTAAAEAKRSSLRLGGRQKEAWDEYCERYERVSSESEAFSRIFGEEFAEAYRRYRRRNAG
jgi:type VI secretion system protein ImpI